MVLSIGMVFIGVVRGWFKQSSDDQIVPASDSNVEPMRKAAAAKVELDFGKRSDVLR